MKQVPLTIVMAILLLIFAVWPGVERWGALSLPHQLAIHVLYVISGALTGLQTSWWFNKTSMGYVPIEESGVSS